MDKPQQNVRGSDGVMAQLVQEVGETYDASRTLAILADSVAVEVLGDLPTPPEPTCSSPEGTLPVVMQILQETRRNVETARALLRRL